MTPPNLNKYEPRTISHLRKVSSTKADAKINIGKQKLRGKRGLAGRALFQDANCVRY